MIVTFTAEGTHPKTGEPTKDEGSDAVSALIDSAAAIGGVSRASDFAARLDRQLCRDGVYNAQEVILVSDGAAWITNVVDELLAGMRKTSILDVFHALEYASAASRRWSSAMSRARRTWRRSRPGCWDGDVAGVIADLRPHRDRDKDVAKCIDDFEANRDGCAPTRTGRAACKSGVARSKAAASKWSSHASRGRAANGRCRARMR